MAVHQSSPSNLAELEQFYIIYVEWFPKRLLDTLKDISVFIYF